VKILSATTLSREYFQMWSSRLKKF